MATVEITKEEQAVLRIMITGRINELLQYIQNHSRRDSDLQQQRVTLLENLLVKLV